ncbi:MAG: hypothetical protein M3069_18210 [Chloroflexota bacterium]|nr:hypothetical protein [Chloroflexota bacterium]
MPGDGRAAAYLAVCADDRCHITRLLLVGGRHTRLERSYGLMRFVDDITRINRGRAFFADPERLGDYILVDYLQQKSKRVAS